MDICKRNGKKKLIWLSDKDKTLAYDPKSGEMVLTVHRWFANKSCPGNWMYARMGDLSEKVTKALQGSSDSEPHNLLFPQAKGILHHGGAGTMASALRSGIPQAIMPLSADQPFWADRLYHLGYIKEPLRESSLSVSKIIEVFLSFDDIKIQNRAFSIGEMIQNLRVSVRARSTTMMRLAYLFPHQKVKLDTDFMTIELLKHYSRFCFSVSLIFP